MSDYIPDGYYFPGHINADAKAGHGELDFEYRPALSEDQAKFTDETALKKDDKGVVVGVSDADYIKAKLAFCAPRIRSWSLKDAAGDPVPYVPAALARVRPTLQAVICAIVLGNQLPDEKKPQAAEQMEQSSKN